MSGHSKWANIKHKKEKLDKQRGKVFSKMSKIIITAARDGGGDLNANLSLKLAVDQAKAANMPKDVIQRAIDRGIGKSADGQQFEEVLYEVYGPQSVPMLILVLTDNKNRTISNLREVLSDHNGRLADIGSVKWQFAGKGLIQLKPAKLQPGEKYGQAEQEVPIDPEEAMLEILDLATVDDIQIIKEDGETILNIVLPFEKLAATSKQLRDAKYIINTSGVHYIFTQSSAPKVDNETMDNLLADLDELDDIQNYWLPA